MSDALSWLVIQKIVELLGVVSVDNGYNTNFGATVRANRYFPKEDEGAHAVVVAGDLSVSGEGNSLRRMSQDILIECRVPMDGSQLDDAERIAHSARLDVMRAIPVRQRGITWPEGCSGVDIVSSRILERPNGLNFVVAQVTARAGLDERHARD